MIIRGVMLPGVWIDSSHEVMYALASKITFICQMDFNAFPVDIQVQTRARLQAATDILQLIIIQVPYNTI